MFFNSGGLFGSQGKKNHIFKGSVNLSMNQTINRLKGRAKRSSTQPVQISQSKSITAPRSLTADRSKQSIRANQSADSVDVKTAGGQGREVFDSINSLYREIQQLDPATVDNAKIDEISTKINDTRTSLTSLGGYSGSANLQMAGNILNELETTVDAIKDSTTPDQSTTSTQLLQLINNASSTADTVNDTVTPLVSTGQTTDLTSTDVLTDLKADLQTLLTQVSADGNQQAETALELIIDGIEDDINGGGNLDSNLTSWISELENFQTTYSTSGNSAFQMTSGSVVIEAENYHNSAGGSGSFNGVTWVETTSTGGYSGTGAITSSSNTGRNAGDSTAGARVDYNINFDSAGTYYVWIRDYGASGYDDSTHIGLDGDTPVSYGGYGISRDGNFGQWRWDSDTLEGGSLHRVEINVATAGEHTLNLYMREDGNVIDKLMVTDDINYTPTGSGPAESAQATETALSSGTLDSLGTILTETQAIIDTGSVQESGGEITVEAENFDTQVAGSGSASSKVWESSSQNGETVISTANTGVNVSDNLIGPRLDYTIDFQNTGTYYVWVRENDTGGLNNSVHVGLDGQASTTQGQHGLGVADENHNGDFGWSNTLIMSGQDTGTRITINVDTVGEHTFNMWMREDGTQIDKFILTQDANYTPTGDGPEGAGQTFEGEEQVAVESRMSSIKNELDAIESATTGIDTNSDLETIGQNTYKRLSNILADIDEATSDETHYAEMQGLRGDIVAAMSALEPYVLHDTGGDSKFDRLQNLSGEFQKVQQLVFDDIRVQQGDPNQTGLEQINFGFQGIDRLVRPIAEIIKEIGTSVLNGTKNAPFKMKFDGETAVGKVDQGSFYKATNLFSQKLASQNASAVNLNGINSKFRSPTQVKPTPGQGVKRLGGGGLIA